MSVADEAMEGSGQSEFHSARRVVLLSESTGLAGLLQHLLGQSGQVDRFASLLAAVEQDALEDADTLVVDLPSERLGMVLAELHHHYQGTLVVLSNRGQEGSGVVFHPGWTLLTRPFSVHILGTALGLPGHDRGEESTPTGESRPPAPTDQRARPTSGTDIETADRRTPLWAELATGRAGYGAFGGRMSRQLAALAQGWQTRRRVRAVGFSVLALVAFSIAFALAARGQCGPGCDVLGTEFSSTPRIAPGQSRAPSTTKSKRASSSTAAPIGSTGTGAFQGVSESRLARTTPERAWTSAATRKPSPGGGGPASTTVVRRPPPATAPPTMPPATAPPTTPPATAPPTTAPATAPPTTDATPPTTAGP